MMPRKIKNYYEPFLGGGSVMFALLHSDIEVENYYCSDINQDLVEFFKILKRNPKELIDGYYERWKGLNKDADFDRRKEYYYSIRERFNTNHNSLDFLFLSRTCINGLIRYNSKGEFNSPLHFSRGGIIPEKLEIIILDWSSKLNNKNVQIECKSYESISTNTDDFIYLDPPYANTKGMYYGSINHTGLWDWMRKQKGNYFLSFNGKRGELDNTFDVPNDLYDMHVYLKSGRSSFKDLVSQQTEKVLESLYAKIN